MQITWIPVSERLPETSEPVLVTVATKGGDSLVEVDRWMDYGEWRYFNNVLAWSPLPEPYKEGE